MIFISVDGLDVAISNIKAPLENKRSMLFDIGKHFQEQAEYRISQSNIGPDGIPWKQSKRALDDGGKTLLDTGRLLKSLTTIANNDFAEVGTNVPYAAIHQFGGKTRPHVIRPKKANGVLAWPIANFARYVNHPGSDIPARPYLGVADDDEPMVESIIGKYWSAVID